MRINRRKPDGMALWMALWDRPKTQKSPANPKACEARNCWFCWIFGCGGRIWTCDLQVMSLTKVAVFCAVYSLALWWRYGQFTFKDGAMMELSEPYDGR